MKNISPTLIISDSLILRKPKTSDITDRFVYGRPKEFRKMCGGDMRTIPPFTNEDAQNFYNNIINRPYEWIIELRGRMIGTTRLTIGNTDNGARYSIGIFDENLYSKGIGTKVTKAILHFAFEDLKLHRVDLRVLEFNLRAICCYEKCGFIKEGIERENAYIEGTYYSDVMMSILENEYSVD
ncbi:GNAT family protein [Mycoplasmatota bacterium WC44]